MLVFPSVWLCSKVSISGFIYSHRLSLKHEKGHISMSFITGLTRMWLTRTAKPFTFKNGYDQILPYAECENLGLYVHIPFCKSICNFCPYCKVRYSAELCDRYIDSLIQEIHIVGSQHAEHRKATSLYFGGGTPALAANRIKEIVNALSEHFIITEGIGLELHPDNVNVETLQMLKDAGVTKISIGIQSFCDKYQKILGRKKIDTAEMMSALSAVSFETVSMDFIFALPGQTYDDLKSDITVRIFTRYLISTRCGVSCEKKHFPNRLNCKRTEIAQCQTTGIVSDRYRSNSS